MPTYLYETIPAHGSDATRRFELRQGFSEPALLADPETGEPVRRVISGGLATLTASGAAPATGPSCGSGSCGCQS